MDANLYRNLIFKKVGESSERFTENPYIYILILNSGYLLWIVFYFTIKVDGLLKASSKHNWKR